MVSPSVPGAVTKEGEMTSVTTPMSSTKNATASSSSSVNLTKKFTRNSLMRATGKPDAATSPTANSTDKSSHLLNNASQQQDLSRMAAARSRAHAMAQRKQKNALVRVNPHSSINHRAAIAAATGEDAVMKSNTGKRIILSGNPYRRFEMSRPTSGAGDEQSHADIVTTMSGLTEPTWGGHTHANNPIPKSLSNLEIVTTTKRPDQRPHNDRGENDRHGDNESRDDELPDEESHDRSNKHASATRRERLATLERSRSQSSMNNDSDAERQQQKKSEQHREQQQQQQQQALTLHTRNGVEGQQQQQQQQQRRDGPPMTQTSTIVEDERRREERRARRRSVSRDGRRKRRSSSSSNRGQTKNSAKVSSSKTKPSSSSTRKKERKGGMRTTRRSRSMSVQPPNVSSRRENTASERNMEDQHPSRQRRVRSNSVNSRRVETTLVQKDDVRRGERAELLMQEQAPPPPTSSSSTPAITMADGPSRISMLNTSTVEGFKRPAYKPLTKPGQDDDDDDLMEFEEASQHPNDMTSDQHVKPQNAIQAARLALRQTQAIQRSHSSSRSVCSHQSNESFALRSLSSAAHGGGGGGSVVSSGNGAAAKALALEKGRVNISNRAVYPTSYSTRSKTNPPSPSSLPVAARSQRFYKSKSSILVVAIGKIWSLLAMIVWGVPITLLGTFYRLFTLQFLFAYRRKQWTTHRKCVLITNAHTQVGWEVAQQLASEGAKLALIVSSAPSSASKDTMTAKQMETMAETCRELGSSKCRVYLCGDSSNSTSIFLTISQARKDFETSSANNRRTNQASPSSPFDVVIINGQTYCHGCNFDEIQDASHIDVVLKQNMLGSILMTHHALPLLKKSSNSRLVVLTSKTGLMSATPTQSVFGATQHALRSFTDTLRLELNETHSSTVTGAPKVCLVTLPDIASTAPKETTILFEHHLINQQDRVLDMGTILPATKTYSWATVPLQTAVMDIIIPTIKSGCQYQTDLTVSSTSATLSFHLKLYESLRPWFPSFVDGLLDHEAKQTYYRPLQEKNYHRSTARTSRGH